MKTNQAGLDLIKHYEGLRLKAYPDPATGGDPWTIGYGSTFGVHPGMVITESQAEEMLKKDLHGAETDVARYVKVDLDENEFSALVSFVFNCGAGNFAKSTLLKKLNASDRIGASAEFAKWNKAAGKPMPGLTKRREAERKLFLGIGQ